MMQAANKDRRAPRRPRTAALVSLGLVTTFAAFWGSVAPGCGGRTPLGWGPPQPECFVDSDCPGAKNLCTPVYCDLVAGAAAGAPRGGGLCIDLEPVDCDDGDPCTEDKCAAKTAECTHEPMTLDKDEDGFRGPLAGMLPGAPGSC